MDGGDDDLALAVCDPTTQVSVSRRAFAPSSVYVHAFFCDTAFMCRTLWSTAIAQHQFYLDQRTAVATAAKKLSNTGRAGAINFDELAEKLTRLTSSSSVSSNNTSSLMSTPSNMASTVRTRDGSPASIPSLHSAVHQKSDEDRQRDLETYRLLKTKKLALEEALTRKLRELRETCISEGEITGEMPKEVYRSLAPGEPEPKIKRRVGTSFSLSSDFLGKHSKVSLSVCE
uniref:Cytohesin Ubiquitin Protein Inducing domain-containing protein n=1 Tax=Plectus sambesii TaxID=2011161 RepID=A0A914WRH6_9BILA